MDTLCLEKFGSFHIGGRDLRLQDLPEREVRYCADWKETYDPNGVFAIEQMYVQYFLPTQRRGPPLIFWPGGGLSGANFETTPDGRMGWLEYFMRRGRPVYNTDPVERGRSGWAMYPQIFPDAPIFMTKERAFAAFRFGDAEGYDDNPACRRPYPGTLFPVQAFDHFVKQIVPRWAGDGAAARRAYQALLEITGPAIVVAFSSGAAQALQLAERRPELFAGLVLIEPAGPGDGIEAMPLQTVPLLVLYGDFLDRHPLWPGIRQRVETYLGPCLGAQGRGAIVDLPKEGARGNSHFLMMDLNSLELATQVETWLSGNC